MNINKHFNAWIGSNFKGLSAYSLCQFLLMEYGFFFCEDIVEVNNLVYSTLYEYFVGNHDDTHTKNFEFCVELVENCAWL